jgi:ADP-ribosyl-[dinitrogen reductase] hydrolase
MLSEEAKLYKFKGALLGVAIGDALGMPVETMTREEILAATDGQGVRDYMSPISPAPWVRPFRQGDTTDDWQLTRAVAMALIRPGSETTLADHVREHLTEFRNCVNGWGYTTEKALRDIYEGKRDPFKDSLPSAKPGKGCGNGVVMKIAPLALVAAVKKTTPLDLWPKVRELGTLTHPDIRASIAAYAVALTIIRCFHESVLNNRFLTEIIRWVRVVEQSEEVEDHTVSLRLEKLTNGLISRERDVGDVVGCGGHAIDTAVFAIGTLMRHPTRFSEGVLEAVNAGGDTDTNASVVGALIGCFMGYQAIPTQWEDYTPHIADAGRIGTRLFASVRD